jgi:hypothetical protein
MLCGSTGDILPILPQETWHAYLAQGPNLFELIAYETVIYMEEVTFQEWQ